MIETVLLQQTTVLKVVYFTAAHAWRHWHGKIKLWRYLALRSPKTLKYQKFTPSLAATNARRSRSATYQQTPKVWQSSATTLTRLDAMDSIIGLFGICRPKPLKSLMDRYPRMPSRGLLVGAVLAGAGRSRHLARTAINFTCTRWTPHWIYQATLNQKNSSPLSRRTSLAKRCWLENLACWIFCGGIKHHFLWAKVYRLLNDTANPILSSIFFNL